MLSSLAMLGACQAYARHVAGVSQAYGFFLAHIGTYAWHFLAVVASFFGVLLVN